MLTLVGTALVLLGLALVLVGELLFLVAAFRESLGWGLLLLFVPPLALLFLILHWSKAKAGFVLQLWGIACVVLGAWVGHSGLPWPLG